MPENIDTLEKFRIKGWKDKAELLHLGGDPLTEEEVAQKMNTWKFCIPIMRKNNQILGVLELDGRQYLYPVCQFDEDGVINGIYPVLMALGDFSDWTKLMWLHTEEVQGRSPLQCLSSGETKAVVDAARCYGKHLAR
jgi:hypothetical protein